MYPKSHSRSLARIGLGPRVFRTQSAFFPLDTLLKFQVKRPSAADFSGQWRRVRPL